MIIDDTIERSIHSIIDVVHGVRGHIAVRIAQDVTLRMDLSCQSERRGDKVAARFSDDGDALFDGEVFIEGNVDDFSDPVHRVPSVTRVSTAQIQHSHLKPK
uniref:Uncharacterized protein n=1 Tax=Cacopsylla melanoneura TaxID=428564 RepID=A0A8D9A126_9HEMI